MKSDITKSSHADPAVSSDGMFVVDSSTSSLNEYYITAVPQEGESPDSIFRRAARETAARGASIVCMDVFGDSDQCGQAMESTFGRIVWPVTWIEQRSPTGHPIRGIHVWAVSGAPVRPVSLDGRVVGCVFHDGDAEYCRLGGLRSKTSGSRVEQSQGVFEVMDSALRSVGMGFSHVVRTWWYLDDILSWYGDFNRMRDRFFADRRVYDGLIPASTGVGMRSPDGQYVIGGLLAVRGDQSQEVVSPLQCSPTEYGSSFSRAVEIWSADRRRLLVSGTASITPDGRTEHPTDVRAQVSLTMDVVSAILGSRGMDWEHVTRAVVYLKDMSDLPAYIGYCGEHPSPHIPAVIIEADVCRDDLLFEIELDAANDE